MRITDYSLRLEDGKPFLVKENARNYCIDSVNNPEKVYQLMSDLYELEIRAEEFVYVIATNTKSKILGVFEISHGTVNSSIIAPREVLVRALLIGASGIILVHNHPSGDSVLSKEDMDTTERMKKSCEMIGISFNDHVILGQGNYYSFYESGLL